MLNVYKLNIYQTLILNVCKLNIYQSFIFICPRSQNTLSNVFKNRFSVLIKKSSMGSLQIIFCVCFLSKRVVNIFMTFLKTDMRKS